MAVFTDPCPRDNESTLASLLGTAIASIGSALIERLFAENDKR